MTHDPEANTTMPVGTGFVMVSDENSVIENVLRRHCRISKVEFLESEQARRRAEALDELGKLDGELLWPGIESDVKDIERLLG